MGNGFKIKCTKCGYEYMAMLGTGILFPFLYDNTVKEIKSGKFGEEYKQFFEEHPDAAVNCNQVSAVCEKCGKLDSVLNMSLYLPEDDTVKNAGYVMEDELSEDFKKCKEYVHKCSCGGTMRTFDLLDELFLKGIKCPKCKGKMMLTEDLVDWD